MGQQYTISTYHTYDTGLHESQWAEAKNIPNTNKHYSALRILFFFLEIIQLTVDETNRYYQYSDTLGDTPHCPMRLYRKHMFLLLCQCSMFHHKTDWKINGPDYNSSLWPVMETQWNKAHSFHTLRFYILVTTKERL
jgi:hypothetical protein